MRIGRHDVAISNPDKLFFPARGLTKGDLVRYYLDVAECALPHLRRRPFHMKRYPNGVDGDFFHQKRVPANHPPYVDEVPVSFPSGHSTVFAIVDNAAALAWVANLGCIELHTWHSRVPEIEKPDYLLIDLDPSAEGQWPYVREIALAVREVMDELGLASFPKTSGATGLHVLAPIRPELPFPEVRRFAKAATRRSRRRRGASPTARASSSTSDRMREIAQSPAPIRCARWRTRASRRRLRGPRSRPSTQPPSRSRRCGNGSAGPGTRCAECGAGRPRWARGSASWA